MADNILLINMKEFIEKNRTKVILFSIWVFINFVCLMVSDKRTSDLFFPFQDNKAITILRNGGSNKSGSVLHAYDFSEFAVYTLFPLFLIFIYQLLFKPKTN